jgi:hypothetical protein
VIRFDSVADPVKLPNDIYFGEVTGVAVNSKGHVFVLSRGNTTGPAYAAAAAQLLEFDRNGKFVREIGKNLYAWSFGHSVRFDREDNVWVTDKGSDMVIKFNPAGRVTMVFGRKQEASDEDTGPLKHPKPPLPPRSAVFVKSPTSRGIPPGMSTSATATSIHVLRRPKPGRQSAGGARRIGEAAEAVRLDHEIARPSENVLYVGELLNWRVQKLILHPETIAPRGALRNDIASSA